MTGYLRPRTKARGRTSAAWKPGAPAVVSSRFTRKGGASATDGSGATAFQPAPSRRWTVLCAKALAVVRVSTYVAPPLANTKDDSPVEAVAGAASPRRGTATRE